MVKQNLFSICKLTAKEKFPSFFMLIFFLQHQHISSFFQLMKLYPKGLRNQVIAISVAT